MIVCAAVKWTNPYTGLEMIIGCIRHADGLAQLNTIRNLGIAIDKKDVRQGFLSHDGNSILEKQHISLLSIVDSCLQQLWQISMAVKNSSLKTYTKEEHMGRRGKESSPTSSMKML